METLKLDEPLKHNWKIKYVTMISSNDIQILAEGRVFDFIPNERDFIRIDGERYEILGRTFNFDTSEVWITLTKKPLN